MGAERFMCTMSGTSCTEAFHLAVDEARYNNGHDGYTGTIAEKDTFKMICHPDGTENYTEEHLEDYAHSLIDNGDKRVNDKWGPAGCIALKDGRYLFFGLASC